MFLCIMVLGLFALWLTRHKMKKTICVLLILLIVYVVIANAMRPEILYPAGFDTIESFGDGTYQVLSGETDCLYNCKYDSSIISSVEHFRIKNGKVYVTGNSIQHHTYDEAVIKYTYELYAVIEMENNHLTLCVIPDSSSAPGIYIPWLEEMTKNGDIQLLSQLTDFSNEDRAAFDGLGH